MRSRYLKLRAVVFVRIRSRCSIVSCILRSLILVNAQSMLLFFYLGACARRCLILVYFRSPIHAQLLLLFVLVHGAASFLAMRSMDYCTFTTSTQSLFPQCVFSERVYIFTFKLYGFRLLLRNLLLEISKILFIAKDLQCSYKNNVKC